MLHDRSKFGLVVDKCEEMCRLVSSLGQQKEVEAQDLMARLTLDIILRAGFGMHASYMSDLQPVPLLQELHYAMEESFRYLTTPAYACAVPLRLNGRVRESSDLESEQEYEITVEIPLKKTSSQ